MDHTLVSLQDAFRDARYIRSRRGYKLYAVLLATTLDQQFLADYLGLFEELHGLTGEDVLVMGVRSGGYQPDPREGEPLVRTFQLRAVANILGHREFEREDRAEDGRTWAARFLSFLRVQTAESYALAAFLGVRTDQFPVMVFFEDLERPAEMVVWPLGDVSASEFARELRHLIEEARARCAWRDMDTVRNLTSVVESLQQREPSRRDDNVPADFGETAKTLWGLRHDLEPHQRVLVVYERIDAIQAAFDELRATAGLRVPLDNVGQTLERLATGEGLYAGISHLVAHERRWDTRLPLPYRRVVAALRSAPDPPTTKRALASREVTAARVAALEAEIARVLEEHDRRRQSELDRKMPHLEMAQRRVQESPRTLSVIEGLLHIRPRPLGDLPAPPRDAFSDMRIGSAPRVFISYSHDSREHAAAVLELAQRLRADGIDCWIDRFESSPAEGFPRWMQHQMRLATYVLLICTATYRTRFDGAEEAGKGLGATFEGHLILQEFYDAGSRNTRFIPVLMPGSTSENVPAVVRGSKWYEVPQAYDALRQRLLSSDAVEPVPLG